MRRRDRFRCEPRGRRDDDPRRDSEARDPPRRGPDRGRTVQARRHRLRPLPVRAEPGLVLRPRRRTARSRPRADRPGWRAAPLFPFPNGRKDHPQRLRLILLRGWRATVALLMSRAGGFLAVECHEVVDLPSTAGPTARSRFPCGGRPHARAPGRGERGALARRAGPPASRRGGRGAVGRATVRPPSHPPPPSERGPRRPRAPCVAAPQRADLEAPARGFVQGGPRAPGPRAATRLERDSDPPGGPRAVRLLPGDRACETTGRSRGSRPDTGTCSSSPPDSRSPATPSRPGRRT